MKKNLTKKLMLSVLTLAFAVVSLGASTFAWFTISDSAKIGTVNATVTGGSGIEVAVGTINWGTHTEYYVNEIPQTKVQEIIDASNYENLNNVSGIKEKDAAAFEGKLYNIQGGDASDKHYIALQLKVKVQGEGKLCLSRVNVLPTTTAKEWNAGVVFKNGYNEDVAVENNLTYSVLSALRVAINVDGGAYNIYEQAAPATTDTSLYRNSLGFSKLGAYDVYNIKSNADLTMYDAVEWDEIKQWTTSQFTTEEYTATTDFSSLAKLPGFEMDDKGNITKNENVVTVPNTTIDQIYTFNVYMWIEGYDAECVNAIFSQGVKLDLGFNFDLA